MRSLRKGRQQKKERQEEIAIEKVLDKNIKRENNAQERIGLHAINVNIIRNPQTLRENFGNNIEDKQLNKA